MCVVWVCGRVDVLCASVLCVWVWVCGHVVCVCVWVGGFVSVRGSVGVCVYIHAHTFWKLHYYKPMQAYNKKGVTERK